MGDAYADVIVVGGGVAGLAAAEFLSAEGKSVILLEGRDRLGGRIETRHDPAWPLPIERGAEFIHGKPRETWDIVRAGGGCLYDVTNEHWMLTGRGRGRGKGGKAGLNQSEGLESEVQKVMHFMEKQGYDRGVGRGGRGATADVSFDQFLAGPGKRFEPRAKEQARLFVEGFNAADAKDVSCAWLAEEQKAFDAIDGDKLFRVYAGYDKVVQFLRTGLGENVRVELSTVVRRIKWGGTGEVGEAGEAGGAGAGGGRVIVETIGAEESVPLERKTFEARQVIVTVPVGVLQAKEGPGAIVFEPPLPAEKQESIGLLRMGAVVKVILRFKEAFWEKQVADLDFIHAPELPFPTWWTSLPIHSTVLTAWAGGPAADALSGRSTGEILSAAIGSLVKMFKQSRRAIEAQLASDGAHVCDWKAEPLSRGAYTYAGVGGSRAGERLAKPVEGVLYFAGEATHRGMSGTVAGAIASGRRAGRQIMAK